MQQPDASEAQLLAEESAILEATEALWGAMRDAGKTHASVATSLGVSRRTVSYALSSVNPTMRSIGRIAYALGYEVRVRLVKSRA